MIPAVEYVQANRIRTLAMQAMHKVLQAARIDVYVAPSFDEADLTRTNLTGHPAVVVPIPFNLNWFTLGAWYGNLQSSAENKWKKDGGKALD